MLRISTEGVKQTVTNNTSHENTHSRGPFTGKIRATARRQDVAVILGRQRVAGVRGVEQISPQTSQALHVVCSERTVSCMFSWSRDVTPVYCGSLASVRSPKSTCPHRVPASSPTSLNCSLFPTQVCKHRLACVFPTPLAIFAGAISSLSIEVVEDCFIELAVVSLTRESTARLELGICACGPSRANRLSKSVVRDCQGGRHLIFSPAVGFAVGVRARATLCSTHREIIVAAEQLRSLPERFRLIRQPLRS